MKLNKINDFLTTMLYITAPTMSIAGLFIIAITIEAAMK